MVYPFFVNTCGENAVKYGVSRMGNIWLRLVVSNMTVVMLDNAWR